MKNFFLHIPSLNNSKGLGLPQVLIAMALVTIFATGAATMYEMLGNEFQRSSARLQVRSVLYDISTHTKNPGGCTTVLPSLPISFSPSMAESASGWPIPLLAWGHPLVEGQFSVALKANVEKLRFIKFSENTDMPNPNPNYITSGVSIMDGIIMFSYSDKTNLATPEQPVGLITLKYNASNQIIDCIGKASAEYRCVSSPGPVNFWDDSGDGSCVTDPGHDVGGDHNHDNDPITIQRDGHGPGTDSGSGTGQHHGEDHTS